MNLIAILVYGSFCFWLGYCFAKTLAEERQDLIDMKADWADWDRQHGLPYR